MDGHEHEYCMLGGILHIFETEDNPQLVHFWISIFEYNSNCVRVGENASLSVCVCVCNTFICNGIDILYRRHQCLFLFKILGLFASSLQPALLTLE